jgi:hypothetical protein
MSPVNKDIENIFYAAVTNKHTNVGYKMSRNIY